MSRDDQIEQIERIQQNNDPQAWEAMIGQFAGAIARSAKLAGDPTDHTARESVVLERFIRAIRTFDTSRQVSPSTYVFRNLRWNINSFEFRGAIRLPNASWKTAPKAYQHAAENVEQWLPNTNAEPINDVTPAEIAERKEDVEQLREAIDQLPDLERSIVRDVLAGKQQEKIGEQMGMSRRKVNAIYHGAIAMLRRCMIDEERKPADSQENQSIFAPTFTGESLKTHETDEAAYYDTAVGQPKGRAAASKQ